MFCFNENKSLILKVIHRIRRFFPINNVNKTRYSKNCLLVYIRSPFYKNMQKSGHQNIPQTKEIAKIIGEFGYNVDVINYTDQHCFFAKKYDAVFDICVLDKPLYWKRLKPKAKKIVYFTGSESEFANSAELSRIRDVQQRRGVALQPRRQAPLISKRVEEFDLAVMIGNEYNLQTYSNFQLKQTSLVPNTGYTFGFDTHWNGSPQKFVYFGSAGCVHKGLDLLLEVFSEPNFPAELYVCGAFERERDFVEAYYKELYCTDNIIPVGFVDIWSEAFKEIVTKCAYTILPSCAEGQAGSVTTMMSAGVIPICSRECGFDGEDVILLPDCSMETIRAYVLEYSQKPMKWIRENSLQTRALAQNKFSKDNFTEGMRRALEPVFRQSS